MAEELGLSQEGRQRRKLLRRGGIVLAGVAGATVAGASGSGGSSAQAAPGETLVLGAPNDSGAQPTSLTSAQGNATLELANTSGPTLRLAPNTDVNTNGVSAEGDLTFDGDSLNIGVDFKDGSGLQSYRLAYGFEVILNQTFTLADPVRILDTRSSGGRVNIVEGKSNLDSLGRLKAQTSIVVDVSDPFGGDESYIFSILGNLTAVTPLAGGFMRLSPPSSSANTSSLNFAKGQTIANFAACGVNWTDTGLRAFVRIYSSATSHVILDLTGGVGLDPFYLTSSGSASQGTSISQITKTTTRLREAGAAAKMRR